MNMIRDDCTYTPKDGVDYCKYCFSMTKRVIMKGVDCDMVVCGKCRHLLFIKKQNI